MKKLLTGLAFASLVVGSSAVFAESNVGFSTVMNRSTNTATMNKASAGFLGSANANTGAVQIEDSNVMFSTISNDSTNDRTTNIAEGGFLGSADANTGSIQIR